MYSPKIAEEMIPSLYRLAKSRKMPMTRLVNSMIREALNACAMQATGPTDFDSQQVEQQAEARVAAA